MTPVLLMRHTETLTSSKWQIQVSNSDGLTPKLMLQITIACMLCNLSVIYTLESISR
jgi:hypothetical protein